jgi:sulfur carrier protein
MKIQVNGAWREVSSGVLAGALEDLGYGASVVSTAVNGEFVPATARLQTALAEGDRIEVLAPMQGG